MVQEMDFVTFGLVGVVDWVVAGSRASFGGGIIGDGFGHTGGLVLMGFVWAGGHID